jgi:hypothetical protein
MLTRCIDGPSSAHDRAASPATGVRRRIQGRLRGTVSEARLLEQCCAKP